MSKRPDLPPVLTVAAMRELEARHAGAPLMERAGQAAAEVARSLAGERGGPVVVLAGPGNNGGDGFVVARRLREAFHDIVVVFPGDPGKLPSDAAAAYAAWRSGGGTTVDRPPARRPSLVIDALFGIGLARALAPPWPALVEWANTQEAPVLALDIPTGLDADTGVAREPAIRASATATFIALKPGLLTHDGVDHCGSISVHALDLDVEGERPAAGHALRWDALAATLPSVLRRSVRTAHKGTFGTLAIVGGEAGLVGAPLLAARTAVRTGAGKVRVGFVAPNYPSVDTAAPETMLRDASSVLAGECDALVLGCGLGTGDAGRAALAKGLAATVPLVLDADALNLIAADPQLRERVRARRAPTLATPHPAEAARLLGCNTATIQQDRLAAARRIVEALGAHVVLKGAGSVLAHPDGTFDINASGNVALATAGSGDVLAGMLGALLAQRIDAKDALRLGVCLHGAAADRLVAAGIGPLGVGASELPDAARDLLNGAARGDL
jgi:hydroxyethylthiazole kinase-like uncharacterized protein yjeF